MGTKKEETQELDVLEQIKKVDKAIKAKLLIEKIAALKEYAREVNELREKSTATLEELGLSDKDMKRVVDYINELPEVKLTDSDKQTIREDIHDEVHVEKVSAEKMLRDVDLDKFITAGSSITTTGGTTNGYGGTMLLNGTATTYPSVTNTSANAMWQANSNDLSFVATLYSGNEKLVVKL